MTCQVIGFLLIAKPESTQPVRCSLLLEPEKSGADVRTSRNSIYRGVVHHKLLIIKDSAIATQSVTSGRSRDRTGPRGVGAIQLLQRDYCNATRARIVKLGNANDAGGAGRIR